MAKFTKPYSKFSTDQVSMFISNLSVIDRVDFMRHDLSYSLYSPLYSPHCFVLHFANRIFRDHLPTSQA